MALIEHLENPYLLLLLPVDHSGGMLGRGLNPGLTDAMRSYKNAVLSIFSKRIPGVSPREYTWEC